MTLRLTPLLTLCAMLSLTTGCGVVNRVFKSGSKPKQPGEEAKQELFIGVVDMVNPEQHFVLVRTVVNMKIKSGSTLEARSPEGEKTTLSVTPEHKVNFISADIMSGTPRRGDAVVLLASEKKDDGDVNKETAEPLKPYVPSEADALIPGQASSPAAATMVPGVAPSDAEMIPGVAPKNVPPATNKPSTGPAHVAPSSGEALPPVVR